LIRVVDDRTNPDENVVNAAKFIGKSRWKEAVFREVYRGKRKDKTAQEIADHLRKPLKMILNAGNELQKRGYIEQLPGYPVTYRKDPFIDQQRDRILRLAANKKARDAVPTKANPKPKPTTITVKVSSKSVKATRIHVEHVKAFSKARSVRSTPAKPLALAEKDFKAGVQRLLGEPGTFTDWGGEQNDLLTTRAFVAGKRRVAAFAFKGPGKKGILKPSGLGANGDQIQRLFKSDAEVFIVQYWGQIDPSVPEQMKAWARLVSSNEQKQIFYAIIDGKDSDRLVLAYPKAFKLRAD
jgi:hypothetical protein